MTNRKHVNIGLDPKEIHGSMAKILPRFPQWISPRITLPVANLGEIPGKIAPRFLPPWICFSARFAVGFRPDFGRRDYCFPARIMARIAAGSCRDFGRREFCFSARILAWFAAGSFPARILARFAARSRRDFGCRDFCFSARILASFAAGSRRDFGRREFRFPARILPGSRRDSRRDRGGIPPRSWSLFYKGWLYHFIQFRLYIRAGIMSKQLNAYTLQVCSFQIRQIYIDG